MNNFQDRIEKLSASKRLLLKAQLEQVDQSISTIEVEKTQIIAYLKGDKLLSVEELKAFAKKRLPDYMIPANYILLEEFPRLPNGKIDKKALVANFRTSTPADSTSYKAPTSSMEIELAAIWEEVLNFSPVGLYDNFFEIGGDSILSIQIISKARKKGIILAANQLFEYQTISELALFAETQQKVKDMQYTPTTTENVAFTLTPIQQWFFEEHIVAPEFWNQGVLFKPTISITETVAEETIRQLILRHEALRLYFFQENKVWKATVQPAEAVLGFQVHTIENKLEIEELVNEVQVHFNLTTPRLFHCFYLKERNTAAVSLVFVVHHLLTDNISWTILLEDFITIAQQLSRNKPLVLAPITCTYKKWSQQLVDFAKSETAQKELPFWKAQIANKTLLPIDFTGYVPIKEVDIIQLSSQFEATSSLISKEVNSAYQTKIEELIIAALVQTIGNWTKENRVTLGLELHGRTTLNDTYPSDTVGWLTSYFPLSFKLAEQYNWETFLKMTKETIRQVPHKGIGYGILRYLEKVDLAYQPAVLFNYLGDKSKQFPTAIGHISPLIAPLRHPESERTYLLEINAYLENDQLQLVWSYSRTFYEALTIKNLILQFEVNLNSIIKHCQTVQQTVYTPSDFSDAALDQADLDHLLNLFK